MMLYPETTLPTIQTPPTVRPQSVPEPRLATQAVTLYGVRWDTYEQLLAENQESSGTRFTYDQGALEIMVLSAEHESYSDILVLLINVVAEEMGVDVASFGSTTFKRRDLQRGFEPDACFYIQNEARVRGRQRLDLLVDPPPDLVVEVDITHASLDKQPIFAAVGVPELWRYDGERVYILTLQQGQYVSQETSTVLPTITANVLTDFLYTSVQMGRTAWLRTVRNWIQTRLAGSPRE